MQLSNATQSSGRESVYLGFHSLCFSRASTFRQSAGNGGKTAKKKETSAAYSNPPAAAKRNKKQLTVCLSLSLPLSAQHVA